MALPMPNPKRTVYILRCESDPSRHYFGLTSDLDARLGFHNAGLNRSTAAHRPWRVLVAVQFTEERRALEFERFLKSGSGRAFAKRHLL